MKIENIREADRQALENAESSGSLSRLFNRATAGYMQAFKDNMYQTIILTALVVLGTPMAMEALARGIRPDTYMALTSARVSWALRQLGPMRERAIRECGPMIIFTYLIQPGGWSFNDLQSLEPFRVGSGKTHAKFLWLQEAEASA